MGLNKKQKEAIGKFISNKLEKKIKKYSRKKTLDNHFALKSIVPRDERRLYTGIHSLLTSFGMSFYEQIAVMIAKENSDHAERQWKSNHKVSKDRVAVIEDIVRKIGNGKKKPNLKNEMKRILSVPNKNLKQAAAGRIVDVYIKRGKKEYYIDIKTVGPNKSSFLDYKRLTLTWVARADKKIIPIIALPYNPYHPKSYKKVGSSAMQLEVDLKVGKSFWDLVGGAGCYSDLSLVFKKTGQKFWPKLRKKF